MNTRMAMEYRALLHWGRQMFLKICHSLEPSSLAASMRLLGMRRIPVSQIEAAKLDGSSEWQIFTRIYLPQCRSALYSIAILVFIDYWNMVEQPLILLENAELQPLSVYLSTINAGEIGLAFAVATIYMIPSLLLFLHGEEYLVEGIAQSGSVKG